MPDVWGECSRFVTRNLCRIIASIFGLLLPSMGAGIGWYVSSSDELARITTATETRSLSTASALDALTAEMRGNDKDVMQALTAIQIELAEMRGKQERSQVVYGVVSAKR
jgi:hypothetical protein